MNPLVYLHTLLLVLVLGLFIPTPVLAQEVNVRTGIHEKYARLVFDWEKRVDYTIERTDKSTLIVTFKDKAALNTTALNAKPVTNIQKLNIISQDPLKVSLSIPEQSRTRDLRAGNKVVIDIYNPPEGAQKAKALTLENKTSTPPAAPEIQSAQTPDTKTTDIQTQTEQPDQPKAKDQNTPEQETPEQETPEQNPSEQVSKKTIKLKMREPPTLITVSSTEKFALASFVLADRVWIVSDKSSLLFKPQLSGPLASRLNPVKEVETPEGKAFTLPFVKDRLLQGKGGGILWRLIIASNAQKQDPVKEVRTATDRNSTRGAKVLWPLKSATRILNLKDPVSGLPVKVVTVAGSEDFVGQAREFVDFSILPSPIGMAIIPKREGITLQLVRGGVEVSSPQGLTVVDGKLLEAMPSAKTNIQPSENMGQRLFDFKAWQLGGEKSLEDNKKIILASLKDQNESGKIEDLVTLAKMYTANAMGPEALGAINLALSELPALRANPEFMALYGVANMLTYRNAEAFQYLSLPILEPFKEANYWRAAVLSNEGDWQQAAELLPQNLAILTDYPVLLQNRLIPKLAEIALRSGDLNKAQQLLEMIKDNQKSMMFEQKAALNYLLGELARQQNDLEAAKKLWKNLTNGKDDFYRARSALALTRLQVQEKTIKPNKAIDNLERLRFAWRGDELEVQINYWLGRTYFESAEFIKGMKIMREAASYDDGTLLGQRIAAEMSDIFVDLFLSSQLESVNPLDAVGLYDEFKELVPLDERGDRIIERLAEHLVKADLLERAGNLLKYQVDHRLEDSEIFRIGVRLAAIRLLDKQPDQAIDALNIAAANLEQLPEELRTPARYREILMLRANALSQNKRPDQALELLNDLSRTPDMNRLRAEIAWTAGYWDDAAEALGDVIVDQNISLTRPLGEENMNLLLQRAIALNLASDRIALANMRERYTDLMKQTPKAKTFELISRPRQSGALADRDTLLSIVSEVDLFQEFLNNYKSSPTPN